MRALPLLCSLCLPLLLAACEPGGSDLLPSCELPDPEEQPAGEFRATVDGDAWTGTANGYQLGATGFFSAAAGSGTSMTVRLSRSTLYSEGEEGELVLDDGDDIEDVFEAGEPADFALGNQSEDGGDVSMNKDNVTFHTNQDGGGGFLHLAFTEDDQGGLVVLGCFEFLAGEANGDALTDVAGGAFVLAE